MSRSIRHPRHRYRETLSAAFVTGGGRTQSQTMCSIVQFEADRETAGAGNDAARPTTRHDAVRVRARTATGLRADWSCGPVLADERNKPRFDLEIEHAVGAEILETQAGDARCAHTRMGIRT